MVDIPNTYIILNMRKTGLEESFCVDILVFPVPVTKHYNKSNLGRKEGRKGGFIWACSGNVLYIMIENSW